MSEDARSSPSEPGFEPDEAPLDPNDIVDEPAVLPPDASEADALDQSRIVPVEDEPYDADTEFDS